MLDLNATMPQIKELLDKASSVLIVTHENPTADSIASSLALYLGLTDLGKKVTIACPDPVTVGLSYFVGADKVVNEAKKNNFIISLDYQEGSIEKVSYNIEGDKFNLVIEPRPGFEPFSQEKVHYAYAGGGGDLIITVDTIHLGGLKKLYEQDKELYASKPIINIDRHPNNAQYGQINLVDSQAASTSEVVARVLSNLGVKLTQDIAFNLLNGVYGATNNFQSATVTAAAFELAAVCIKAGGKKFQPHQAKQEEAPVGESVGETKPVQTEAPVNSEEKPVKPHETPAEWLKPKIFKSSSIS